ncbi:MAG: sterol desaturase family protein, partial [Myxococcales bacterium]
FAPTLARALRFLAMNAAVSFALSFALGPLLLMAGVHLGPLPAWWVVALQLAFFLVLDDALFYAVHRLLHTRWLYRHVHAWHHRVYAPFALSGAIMHPLEWGLISAMVALGPLLVGAHLYVFWAWVIVRQWENAEFHSGFKGPWRLGRLLPFCGGVEHHDLHHARVHGNYAAIFTFWDRWLGTELTSYDTRRERPPRADAA